MASIMTGNVTPAPDKKTRGFARAPTPKISQQRESSLIMNDQTKKNLPTPYKLRRYYLPAEVALHNSSDSCWISMFQRVYDLTKLIQENHESTLIDPIVLAAGTDITHWFNPDTREPKTFVDPTTGIETCYCPTGRYLHIPPDTAHSDVATEAAPFDQPWWQDSDKYMIGRLTKKVRKINLMNTH